MKNPVEPVDWNQALYHAIRAARKGREVLLSLAGNIKRIEAKFQAGLVSEADREAEKAVFAELRQHFPNDEFVGEESSFETKTESWDPPPKNVGRWIVDPLDGTTNYLHQFPMYTVSIGYEWNGQMQLAVIDAPAMGEVYTAIRGKGAFLNGKSLHVSDCDRLDSAFLTTGFFNEVEENLAEQLKIFSQVVRRCRAVRRAGAASYDLALVARGVFDGYWEKGLKPWDSAAGILLVREAGGVVLTYQGSEYSCYDSSLVAGTPSLVGVLQPMIRSIVS